MINIFDISINNIYYFCTVEDSHSHFLKNLLDKHAVAIVGVTPSGTFGLTLNIATLFAKDCELYWGWVKTLMTVNSIGFTGSYDPFRSQSPRRTFNAEGKELKNFKFKRYCFLGEYWFFTYS